MSRGKNPALSDYARELRKNMTLQERRLWYDCLKQLPETVNRQKVIGNYIVDFYIASKQLVIELDGSQHYDEQGQLADQTRDQTLRALGLTILRYSNEDINLRFQSVCEDIYHHLHE